MLVAQIKKKTYKTCHLGNLAFTWLGKACAYSSLKHNNAECFNSAPGLIEYLFFKHPNFLKGSKKNREKPLLGTTSVNLVRIVLYCSS
jgi:hypothetical protein